MGELSSRYLKLVFPEIEPHKCVKKIEKKGQRKAKKTDRIYVYIILIEGAEERKERMMRGINIPMYIDNKSVQKSVKCPEVSKSIHKVVSKSVQE